MVEIRLCCWYSAVARGCGIDTRISNAFDPGASNMGEAARYLIRLPNLVIQAIDVSNKKDAGEQEDSID